ncbi:MAG: AN1-type zinc finger protein [Candidatus Hodarchaeales archaeon]
MVILSQNKSSLKTVGFYFIFSISASILFYVVSYSFDYSGLFEFSFIFRLLSLVFLIISSLFGFSLGQIFVRIYRDKFHNHVEEEINDQDSIPDQQYHYHGHNNDLNPESITKDVIKKEIVEEKKNEQLNIKVYCKECSKEIFNPYKCKNCNNFFCGVHIIAGDHVCS